MNPKRGAIFDLDGTLLDSIYVWKKVDSDMLKRWGISPVPEGYNRAVAAMSFQEAAEYTIRRFGIPMAPEEMMAVWHREACLAYTNDVALKPFAADYLRALRDRGVRLAVATGCLPELYEPALKRHGIYDLFESFTTLKEVARGKKFPDIYQRAAEKMGLPPADCAVFEDVPEGVMAARAGGFFTVAVADPDSASFERELRAQADVYLENYAQALDSPVLVAF